MHSLKNNKLLLGAFLGTLALIPVFMFGFDPEVMRWTSDFHKGNAAYALIVPARSFINTVSNGVTLIGLAFLLFLVGRFRNPAVYEIGRSLLTGLISAGVLVQILKHLIGRARPRLTYDLVFIGPSLKSGYDSFPSGHTTFAFCLAYIVSRFHPRWGVVSYFFAIMVGFSRVDGLSHFPSDVLAGAIVGTIAAKLITSVMDRRGAIA